VHLISGAAGIGLQPVLRLLRKAADARRAQDADAERDAARLEAVS
jgi:hypothetical protein